MDVNYHGTVNMTLAHLPLLRRAGRGRARVVNVASVAGFLTVPGMAAFTASKHAIEGFSDVLRLELGPFGIGVSVMEPSFQRTNIILNIDRQIEDAFQSGAPTPLRFRTCSVPYP
jgi:NAD(P)-dependent dehydrogenase (short-subunit alcohol dehydrogenase family)